MRMRNKRPLYALISIIFTLIIVSTILFIMTNEKKTYVNNEYEESVDFVIGVAQSQLIDQWQINMNKEIKNESKNYENIEVIYTDAVNSDEKQIDDINKLMGFGIDLLIISPTSSNSKMITDKVMEVYKDIPVIVLDREVEGYGYTLYIGQDNLMIGKQAGEYISDILEESGGKVVEIKGSNDSSSMAEMSLGVRNELEKNNNIEIIEEINGGWNRDIAEDKMYDIFNTYNKIEVVFAHNDAMALGAYTAYKKLEYPYPVKFIGIGGLQGDKGGLDLVEKNIFSSTIICPTGGKEAIQYAIDILNKESGIPKKVILRSKKITRDNLQEYKYEENKKLYINQKEEPIVLGFCNVGNEGGWREAHRISIKEAAKNAGVELVYAEAGLSQERQIEIIREFIKIGVDVISFSPVVEDGWDGILREAKEAEIPVILSDRSIKTEDKRLYTTFIGSDFREEGRRAARWVLENMDMNEKINVVEIKGTKGSTPAIERKIGFEEVTSEYENINIIKSKSAEYTFDEGKAVMESYLDEIDKSGEKINLVYCHNDDMALGAIKAIEEYGLKPGEDIKIISIDGIKKAIIAIKDGKLNCSVECNPLIGPQIIKVAVDVVNGKDIPMMIMTEETVFSENEFDVEWLNRTY